MHIRRALISVWDKTGIVEFARALHEEFKIEIISTGGTAKALTDAGIPVTLVETLTGCGEMLGGRVKTLHPVIHAAILADRDNPEHMRQLAAAGIKPIDMVVVNLYPFEKTVADPNCTFEQAIEMIDIGGVALLRAAAKNHRHVVVLSLVNSSTALQMLDSTLKSMRSDEVDGVFRKMTAQSAVGRTCRYDFRVAEFLEIDPYGPRRLLWLERLAPMRYGENPHQSSGVYWDHCKPIGGPSTIAEHTKQGRLIHATNCSFNNYLDADSALGLCAELTRAGREKRLWYRLPAGSVFSPASSRAGGLEAPRNSQNRLEADTTQADTTEADTTQADTTMPSKKAIRGETFSRRYLPHIESPGRTYFVTFRTLNIQLPDAARDVVLSACRHWHGQKLNLHIVSVMPDHVHLLMTPFLHPDGSAVPLSEITHSIKSYSSNQVNKLLGRSGSLWMQERFDRIMRDEREFVETWEYIETNPERAGLGEGYRWNWKSETGFEEGGLVEPRPVQKSGLEAPRNTQNRLEADTTVADITVADITVADTTVADTTVADITVNACNTSVVCFIKHANACGVGIAAQPIEAYRQAYLGDPNAAMGGILACNFAVDAEFAAMVMQTYDQFGKPLKESGAAYAPGGFFVEVWIAPAFESEAIKVIRGTLEGGPKKKWGESVRLLAVGDMSVPLDPDEMQYRSIAGGMLVQTPDLLGLNEEQWKVATKRAPTDAEMADLRLAWLICKHTKSNAITLVKDGMLIGNGAGQMSRVMSCRIATWLARENGHADRLAGSVAASDAFFPFADGPRILIDAGATAIIQPGGSKRDEETIALCDEKNIAMIFTGTRHFRH